MGEHIVLSKSVGDTHGRVFFRQGALTFEEATGLLRESLTDPDDVSRLELLRQGLTDQKVAVFATHRTLDAPDVIQAFLRMDVDGNPAKVFACTVLSLSRVERDLKQCPFVVEGLSLQVTSTVTMTHTSLETALQAWCERLFPAHRTTTLLIEILEDPLELGWLPGPRPGT